MKIFFRVALGLIVSGAGNHAVTNYAVAEKDPLAEIEAEVKKGPAGVHEPCSLAQIRDADLQLQELAAPSAQIAKQFSEPWVNLTIAMQEWQKELSTSIGPTGYPPAETLQRGRELARKGMDLGKRMNDGFSGLEKQYLPIAALRKYCRLDTSPEGFQILDRFRIFEGTLAQLKIQSAQLQTLAETLMKAAS